MNEQFLQYKKKIWRDVALKCALAAAAVAVLTVNAVLLPCLLCGVKLYWAWYLLIGLGGLVAGGGIAFLFLRTDDKKIAIRLDRELNLSERTQTALLYGNDESDMLSMQRADAAAALKRASKLSFCNLALTVVLGVLLVLGTAALPIVAVFANTDRNAGTVQPYDPPRDVTDWEWQALDELIDYVKASQKASDGAKQGMVGELEGLRSVLKAGVSESSLPTFVQNTVSNLRNAVSDANESLTDEQKTSNDEECDYVVRRLYEIFSLKQPGGDDGPVTPPDDKPKEPTENPGNNIGTGDLVIEGVPFFDPERGYVSSGDPEVREKYYSEVQQAMLEGTISREQWEEIVATYFADLRDKEEE